MQRYQTVYFLADLKKIALEQLESVHTLATKYTDAVLQKKAADGGWSVVDCLEHLNTYCRYYIPRMKSALQQQSQPLPKPYVKKTWIGGIFVNIMKPTGVHRKYKAVGKHIPGADLSSAHVMEEFIAHQRTLVTILDDCKDKNLQKVHVAMSFFKLIRLNGPDILEFLITHQQRHLQQAWRNIHQS